MRSEIPARIPPRDLAPRGREKSRGRANSFPHKNSLPYRVRISSFNHLDFARNSSELYPIHTTMKKEKRKLITITNATPKDIARVSYVTKIAYQSPYKTGGRTTRPALHSGLTGLIEDVQKKHIFILVAIDNKKIIASIRYRQYDTQSVYLHQLAVLKTYRKRGIGTALIYAVENEAKKKGCTRVILDCMQEKELPAYYESLGYHIDRIEEKINHHAVWMSKELN